MLVFPTSLIIMRTELMQCFERQDSYLNDAAGGI